MEWNYAFGLRPYYWEDLSVTQQRALIRHTAGYRAADSVHKPGEGSRASDWRAYDQERRLAYSNAYDGALRAPPLRDLMTGRNSDER